MSSSVFSPGYSEGCKRAEEVVSQILRELDSLDGEASDYAKSYLRGFSASVDIQVVSLTRSER